MAKITKSEIRAAKESKTELFIRLGIPRIEKVLKSLRILGNCSNRNNYEYTPEQIDKMSIKLLDSLDKTIQKFHQTKKEQESFEF
ncbi:hypothetical protein LCGC14_0876580 [marine sediment metagenome]|uniref:Uncharacterized protein n=1 Tax=marine sediment metagenome TaxID=412755 RepID=A0A0F9RMS4_9ZZZZ|nr:hypothetical protein [bacterium]